MRSPLRPFRFLLPAERALLRAYPRRGLVDLRRGDPEADDPARAHRWGRSRTVRARFLASLLLSHGLAEAGSVPGVHLVGARITGSVDLRDAELKQSVQIDGCHLDGVLALTGASTKGLRLRGSRILRINAARARIDGDLALSESEIPGGIELVDAHITGQVRLNRATVGAPTRATLAADPEVARLPPGESSWAVWAGGLMTEGGVFGRELRCEGGLRFIGARLRGGLYLENAEVKTRGTWAVEASHLEAGLVEFSRGFTAEGTVRMRGARIHGVVSFDRAVLRASGLAVHLSHAKVDELILLPQHISGEVNLSFSHFAVIFDAPSAYPGAVRLNGTTYGQLRGAWSAAQRRRWVSGGSTQGYRPQPYEQLASWYRAVGNEGAAHRVLLDKQRARRRVQGPAGRLWGLLLDAAVGYGYRPWLAALWAAVLLACGTAVFHAVPPTQVPLDEVRTFHAFVYTLDLLVPVSVFEQRGAWEPVGWTRWLAWGLIAAGWILATALVAGATRVLRPAPGGS